MGIKLTTRRDGRILEVVATGRLNDEDYRWFVPEFDRLARKHGSVRVLFELFQFRGWNARAAWDDFKFGVKHFGDIERLALVGEKKWHRWMAELCRPFTRAQVRYYDAAEIENARAWLEADGQPGAGTPSKGHGSG